jgi:uncharacterized protein YdhG (YjbR/CyaY superfamily)
MMEGNKIKFNSIDEYIGLYPSEVQDILTTLRKVIKESAPEATEKLVIKCQRLLCTEI